MKQTTWIKKLTVLLATGLLSAAASMTSLASVRLDRVADAYWDEENMTLAVWEPVEDAYQYQVYLYCDEKKVAEIRTKKEQYEFEKKMTKAGDYMFRVRALAKGREYRDGFWSEYSDSIYIDADFAELMENGGVIDTNTSGPGAKTDGSGPTKATGVVYKAGWVQDSVGWWYRREDGSWPVLAWWQDPADGTWYYFNEQGYMVTGERTIDGVAYRFDDSGAWIPES